MKRYYPQRRVLRRLERGWTRIEVLLNRLTSDKVDGRVRPWNPLYHLGTLAIFLLIVLAVTGTYLTIFYRPGADRAYETVMGISHSWLGSLMRTVHRYAADGLLLVILLHALKMFLSDRFWGSRWLAWVSGWLLLILIWIIGVMGYWLVWDQRAQWLTEYAIGLLKGAFALAFITPEIASRTFAFFVIILFLHIFLSVLIVLGILVHELRLSRARWWSPRWLMVGTGLVLVALALARPATNAPPADLSRLVGTISLDHWYLGFLRPTSLWGNLPFWGAAGLVMAVLLALPWLARGRTMGPAVVAEPACTGCTLCFQQCPYEAIEMRPRTDEAPYPSRAVVNPALCTGCGICVGTCAPGGMELIGLPTSRLRETIREALASARAAGQAPVVIFTCQRHTTLGSLPEALPDPEPTKVFSQPLLLRHAWSGSNPHLLPLVSLSLPCAGMLQPTWARESLKAGARAVLVLSCPEDDCAFREGPRWLAERLGRRHALVRQGVYWLEAAPGDRHAVTTLLTRIAAGAPADEQPSVDTPQQRGWRGIAQRLRSGLVALALLTLTFGLALTAERPTTASTLNTSMIRLGLAHPGKLKAPSSEIAPEVMTKLPDSVAPEQVLGGERFPVHLRVEVDGKTVLERTYRPRGLRREGITYGLESWTLPPGSYRIRIWMMDDGEAWRLVFDDRVEVEAGRVRTLLYDEEGAVFHLY